MADRCSRVPHSYIAERLSGLFGFTLSIAYIASLLALACSRSPERIIQTEWRSILSFALCGEIVALLGERQSRYLRMSFDKWKSKRILGHIRLGTLERVFHFTLGSVGAGIVILVLECLHPQQSPPLVLIEYAFALECVMAGSVFLRAQDRISRVQHLARDYWSLFHAEETTRRLEARTRYLRKWGGR